MKNILALVFALLTTLSTSALATNPGVGITAGASFDDGRQVTVSGTLTTGHCLQAVAPNKIADSGAICGGGGGSGTVNAGTAGQVGYYATSDTAISGNSNLNMSTGDLTVGQATSVLGRILLSGNTSGTTALRPAAAASGVLTLPAATDTLIGKATTDTLTNKTFDTAGSGNSFSINGVAITANTGTGSNVLATSPTLVTPVLGVATGTSWNGLALSISANDTTTGGTVLIGTSAGANLPSNAAYGNFFAGYQSGLGSGSTTTAAIKNTAIGYQSLLALTSANNNTAIGYQAMLAATSGIDATAVGSGACAAFTTANLNTCVGFNAGNTTTGAQNTLIGGQAGDFISSGAGNTAVGYNAMLGATGNKVTGSNNTAIGQTAMLAAITTAAGNTVIGQAAANKLTTGGTNVIIGQGVASTTLTTGSGNILIGNSSVIDAASSSTSNTLIIGNNATTPVISCTGINSTPACTINSTLNVSGTLSVGGTAVTDYQNFSFQPGLLTAVTSTKGVFAKSVKALTVDNIEASAITFVCAVNPVVTMYECGTDASCASPTTIGSATITASGQAFDGSISNAAIAAGHYLGWAISSGTCTSIDLSATAQAH